MAKKKKQSKPKPAKAEEPAADEPEVTDDDVKVVIEADGKKVETTLAGMKEAAANFVPSTEWNTPEALAKYDFETQERVGAQCNEVEEIEADYEAWKAGASERKKDLEAAEKTLRTLIRERADRRGKPPVAETGNLFKAVEGADQSDVWPPANLWEEFPIPRLEKFGLSLAIIEKLVAGEMKKGAEGIGPINTMGAMSRFTAATPSGWTRQLTDIKGIGDKAADEWRDAETKFWADWNNGGGEKFADECGLKKPEPVKDAADAKPAEGDAVAVGNDKPADETAAVAA